MNDSQLQEILKKNFKLTEADRKEISRKQKWEKFWGVNKKIFEKTRRFYKEVKGQNYTPRQALKQALNKAEHKAGWNTKERNTIDDIRSFYQEVNIYPFRQPYNKRFGGYRYYLMLVEHIKRPSILEYGCGSAVMTEYFMQHFPDYNYTVADIPSVTLEFVKWKKDTYNYNLDILTIGKGKEGIPLINNYDLIICQDVLEHTPNPLEIVQSFALHLNPGGVLILDFLNAPGGENLELAVSQREEVKTFLAESLVPVKAIDEGGTNNGLYFKSLTLKQNKL